MNNSVRKRVSAVFAVVACMALAGVVVAGGALAKGHEPEVVCKKIGKHKVSCPKKELHGKHGKNGAPGAPGAPGPAGPAGPAGANGVGFPLIFRGASPTSNTTIFKAAGLQINASCAEKEAGTNLTAVSEIGGSLLRATDLMTSEYTWTNNTAYGEKYNLDPGGFQDQYVLSYLAGNGSSIITANYGIASGPLSLLNVSCAVFGTVQLAAG